MNILAIKFKGKHAFNQNDVKMKEQFYSICSNIESNLVKVNPLLLMVTSLKQTKSIVRATAHLALALSEQGKRVLLVDGNLREPSLHHLFRMDNSFGLSNLLLRGKPTSGEEWIKIADNLFCLPTGEMLYEPSTLLSLETFPHHIEKWKQQFDIILFHTSNSLHAPDAQIVAQHCDGIVLAIMEGRDKLEKISSMKKQFERAKHEITGAVIVK